MVSTARVKGTPAAAEVSPRVRSSPWVGSMPSDRSLTKASVTWSSSKGVLTAKLSIQSIEARAFPLDPSTDSRADRKRSNDAAESTNSLLTVYARLPSVGPNHCASPPRPPR